MLYDHQNDFQKDKAHHDTVKFSFIKSNIGKLCGFFSDHLIAQHYVYMIYYILNVSIISV